MINKLVFDCFDEKNDPTIGIDFVSKSFTFDEKPFRYKNIFISF